MNCSCAGFNTAHSAPFSGVHGTRVPSENELWSCGHDAESVLTSFDRLRYRLLPYIYPMAWKITSESYTPMRPLVMDFRDDVKAQNIGDQFIFGPGRPSFNVVLTGNGHGTGIDPTAEPDKTVQYAGKSVTVSLGQ